MRQLRLDIKALFTRYRVAFHAEYTVLMNPVQKMLLSVSAYTKSFTELWEQSVTLDQRYQRDEKVKKAGNGFFMSGTSDQGSRGYRIHAEPCKQNSNPR